MSRIVALSLVLSLSTLCLSGSVIDARADFLNDALGTWAIGGSANCGVPAKFFTLTTYGGNITWRNGTGDVDIETIILGNDRSFQTVTVNSMHKSGHGYARGTAWTYTDTGPGFMQVSVENGNAFVLGRCG